MPSNETVTITRDAWEAAMGELREAFDVAVLVQDKKHANALSDVLARLDYVPTTECHECKRLGDIVEEVAARLKDWWDAEPSQETRYEIRKIQNVIADGTYEQQIDRFLEDGTYETFHYALIPAIRAEHDELKRLRARLAELETHV